MEPMVVAALGIVIYCGYLTLRDLAEDLEREGFRIPSRSKATGRLAGSAAASTGGGTVKRRSAFGGTCARSAGRRPPLPTEAQAQRGLARRPPQRIREETVGRCRADLG